MWTTISRWVERLLVDGSRCWREAPSVLQPRPATAGREYHRIERVVLTDQVSRTLFEEFRGHRQSERGAEETGWILLGLRLEREVLVLATLPAGTQRDAGVAHVQFNSEAQVLGFRYARQKDKRLSMVGVVHTHPGSLRHPSDGDFRGDSQWVGQLRGGEGVFGIGTADMVVRPVGPVSHQPEEHMQALGELGFCWYALGRGEGRYRKLPVDLTLGPDLARPLHAVWETLEAHAAGLDRLCRQQTGVTLEVGPTTSGLTVDIPLAEPEARLHLALQGSEVRYVWIQNDEARTVDPDCEDIDRGVYLILAELAGKAGCVAAGRR